MGLRRRVARAHARLGDDPFGHGLVPLVQAGDGEAHARTLRRQGFRSPEHVGQVAEYLLGARAGQDRHEVAGLPPLLGQEALIQRPIGQLVEVGMAHVDGPLDPARLIPRRLEREAA